MNHFKNILLYSFICSIVLFTNCGEDEEEQVEEQVEEPETTPITTGLSENQDLLIGSWDVVENDQNQIVADLGTIVFSFELISFLSNKNSTFFDWKEYLDWIFDLVDPLVKSFSLSISYVISWA